MMSELYTTAPVDPARRAAYWSSAVSKVLFPMAPELGDPNGFSGVLKTCDLRPASLTLVSASPAVYRRERRHLAADETEELLVSFAGKSELLFTQNGASMKCGKGEFVIQRGHAPYEFIQPGHNDILVFKLPASMLSQRLRALDRYTSHVFSSRTGAGAVLLDMLRVVPRRIGEVDGPARAGLSACLIDLLALTLEGDPRALEAELSSVQAGHLARAERFIRQNLGNRELSPELVAAACGISVRYLHRIFSRGEKSLGRWMRELRLQACARELREARRHESIAEIAYRWGFNDQAQFSRHFKARFGCTASETRAEAKLEARRHLAV